jgi:hypothetical protein
MVFIKNECSACGAHPDGSFMKLSPEKGEGMESNSNLSHLTFIVIRAVSGSV